MDKVHKLERVQFNGFKSIHTMGLLNLNALTVLIGANGAGKSNFIGNFRLLKRIIDQNLQQTILGGGGGDKFLHYGAKNTETMQLACHFEHFDFYAVKLKAGMGDRLLIESETCWFTADKAYRNMNRDGLESALREEAIASPFESVQKRVYEAISNWRIYHFHDTSASAKVKKYSELHDVEFLREDARNLGAFLYNMRQVKPMHYERIVKLAQRVVPDFKDFYLEPPAANPETILLRWLDTRSDMTFTADDLSDGSLRFICLTTLLMQPELPPLVLIDEPELGLHPHGIDLLTEMLKLASGRTQVIVATQSERLVGHLEPEQVIVVDKENGASTFKRLDKDQLTYWMSKYNLAEMWDQNIIGGQP